MKLREASVRAKFPQGTQFYFHLRGYAFQVFTPDPFKQDPQLIDIWVYRGNNEYENNCRDQRALETAELMNLEIPANWRQTAQ